MKQRRPSLPQPKRLVAIGSKQPGTALQANADKFEAALAMHEKDQWDQAEAIYKEILQSQPQHFDAMRLLATIAAQRKHSAAAVALFEQALKLNPDHASTLNNRGNALLDLKRHKEALESYDRALKLEPDYAEALFNRGNAWVDLKRHEQALQSYDRAIEIQSDYVEALYNRGNTLLYLNRHQDALRSYERALEIKPDHVEALVNRCSALLSLKRHTESIFNHSSALLDVRYTKALCKLGSKLRHTERAGKNIIVSGNCQTGGLAAALQVLCPRDNILPILLNEVVGVEGQARLFDTLQGSDAWVTIGHQDLVRENKVAKEFCTVAENLVRENKVAKDFKYIRAPAIHFSAFHPDICYAKKKLSTGLIFPIYNSAIAMWAYKNRLEVQDAKRLFNARTYAALGYFDEWDRSVAHLKGMFDDCSFDFNRFFLGVKRDGVFMYVSNHPKAATLVRLAKQVAVQLGQGESIWEKAIDINDGLTAAIWPLYPEIADHYALPGGSYDWKMGAGRWLIGLEEYLEYAFKQYAEQGVDPEDLVYFDRDEKMYDRVLGGK